MCAQPTLCCLADDGVALGARRHRTVFRFVCLQRSRELPRASAAGRDARLVVDPVEAERAARSRAGHGHLARVGLHRIPFEVQTLKQLFRELEEARPSEAESYPYTFPLGR